MSSRFGLLVRISLGLASLAGVGCGADVPRGEAAEFRSESGELSARVTWHPDPPRVGNNSLGVELVDVEGTLVTGAMLTVFGWMPVHGHSMQTATVSDAGDGTYRIDPVALAMPGRWELRVDVSTSASQDHLDLAVDVQ